MKVVNGEPLIVVPAAMMLLFGFAFLATERPRVARAGAIEVLQMKQICEPLAAQPGAVERSWACRGR